MMLCVCACGATATSRSNNLGDAQTETGFKPVMVHDGTVKWLCPRDAAEAMEHAGRLMELLGSKWVVPPMLWDDKRDVG